MAAEDQLSKGGYNFNRHTDIRQQKIKKMAIGLMSYDFC